VIVANTVMLLMSRYLLEAPRRHLSAGAPRREAARQAWEYGRADLAARGLPPVMQESDGHSTGCISKATIGMVRDFAADESKPEKDRARSGGLTPVPVEVLDHLCLLLVAIDRWMLGQDWPTAVLHVHDDAFHRRRRQVPDEHTEGCLEDVCTRLDLALQQSYRPGLEKAPWGRLPTVDGWRAWLLEDGELLPPYASLGPHGDRRPWRRGVNKARCYLGHPAPSPACECGIRAMQDVSSLCRSLDVRHLRFHRDGQAWFEGRWTVDDLGAIGLVRLSGVVIGPSKCDPAGTSRGSRGELLRLYVAERHEEHAERLAERLHVEVTVGLAEAPV
jgi:hypothetical protein